MPAARNPSVHPSPRRLLLAAAASLLGCAGAGAVAPPPGEPTAPVSAAATGAAVAAPVAGSLAVGPSAPAGNNLIWNGTFEKEALRPWSLTLASARDGRAAVKAGEVCVDIDRPGQRPIDIVLRQGPLAVARGHRYQLRFRAHASAPARLRARLSRLGSPYAEWWGAVGAVDASPRQFTGVFDAATDEEKVELVFELGGPLAGAAPITVCLADVELNDPQFDIPVERLHAPPVPRVRVNQVGYLPAFAKVATVATDATAPLDWQLVDARGTVRARGKTRPFGEDRSSGERVQQIDFSSVTAPGKGLRLRVGADESVPFDIAPDVYRRLKYDALSFFYLQRSGVPIKMPFAGSPAYERPPGHPGDRSVACSRDAGCSYSLDVSGGWYDAGDHGKYLVNGGMSAWLLQNQYEMLTQLGSTASDFGDGKMNIPERGNGAPDLLDEARFEMNFLLAMQIPAGQPLAGMAHQKVHADIWSPIPTLPHQDPFTRFLRPASTAATLNLAASAAQAARLWRKLDAAFAARCLTAAEIAFAAARKNPLIRADGERTGGGAYGDANVSDEFYWAAAELFITTGKPAYRDELARSPFHVSRDSGASNPALNVGWDNVAALGKISLAVAPNDLGAAAIADQRRDIVAAADRLLAVIAARGYRVPMASDSYYNWGSNGVVLDEVLVLGAAYVFTRDAKYANGAIDGMDYILGRNPLALSYVAGFGARAMRNPHHRVWAHEKDARLPEAPPGAVSGGPNSALQDPYIRKMGMSGCPPQTCYVDNTDSYSTNEVAINWNAALAWDAAFLDDLARR